MSLTNYAIEVLLFLAIIGIYYYIFLRENYQKHAVEELDGWIYPSLDKLLLQKEMIELMQEVDKDKASWLNGGSAEYYMPWQNMSDSDMLASLWEYFALSATNSNENGYEERVRLSAAAITQNVRIPSKLWLYNRDVLTQVARYQVLRGFYFIQDGMQVLSPYVAMPDIEATLITLAQDKDFLKIILTKNEPPAAFAKIWYQFRLSDKYKVFFSNEPIHLKKILTAFYAISGMYIPRDYLYYDSEVQDIITHYLNLFEDTE